MAEVSTRSLPLVCLPTLLPSGPHVCLSGGRRLDALTSGNSIACSWRAWFGRDGGGCGSCLGTPSWPSVSYRQTRTLIQKPDSFIWGDTWHFWVWALHANIKGWHVTSSQSAEGQPGSRMGSSAFRCSTNPGCFCQTLGEIHPQL